MAETPSGGGRSPDQQSGDGRPAGQPRGAKGTVGHAYSALNLRLALALFGLVVSAACAVLLFSLDHPGYAGILAALAGVALIDVVVVQRRRAARRRAEPRGSHSWFE